MPRSSSPPPKPRRRKSIPLFDRAGPSLRPDLTLPRAARAAVVRAGRRPPPKAARSGLDHGEHAAPMKSGRRLKNQLDRQQSIFEAMIAPIVDNRDDSESQSPNYFKLIEAGD